MDGGAASMGGIKIDKLTQTNFHDWRQRIKIALVSILLLPRLKSGSDEAQMRLPLTWSGNAAYFGCLGQPLRVFIVNSRRVGP